MSLFLGTSGYSFDHWKDKFYKTKNSKNFLSEYSQHFKSVEVNNTFYKTPTENSIENWKSYNLNYTFKVHRYFRNLLYSDADIQELKESWNIEYILLKDLCEVFVLQFDDRRSANIDAIERLRKTVSKKARIVIEGRNDTWTQDDVLEKLVEVGISLVILPRNAIAWLNNEKILKYMRQLDFVYIRFHGPKLYAGHYSDEELKRWKKIIKSLLKQKKDVYCFFNNDENAAAPEDALRLQNMM